MTEHVTIAPCPFCGMREADPGAEFQRYVTVEPRGHEGALRVNMDGFGWYWVQCGNCMAQGPKYHGMTWFTGNTGPKNFRRDRERAAAAIAKAVGSWNVRAEPTLFDTEVDE